MRPFIYTALVFCALLALGGAAYAYLESVPTVAAAGVIAAFLLQVTLFLLAGFPAARKALELAFSPPRLAILLAVWSATPYLVYAIPGGVFAWRSFALILASAAALAFWYVRFPVRAKGIHWADIPFIIAIAYPSMMSRTFPILEQVYASPAGVPRVDFLGKLMLFSLGAVVMLSMRRVPNTGYELAVRGDDWRGGLLYGAAFLPVGIALGVWLEYVRLGPQGLDDWTAPLLVAGSAVGIYLGVALPEELLFRGVLQNLLTTTLRSRWLALAAASLLFGLSHWPRRYPDPRFAVLAAVAGVFYGLAYMRTNRVPAAAVAHTLVVLVQRFAFS